MNVHQVSDDLVLLVLVFVLPFKHGLHGLQQRQRQSNMQDRQAIVRSDQTSPFAHRVARFSARAEEIVPDEQQQQSQRQHVELEVPNYHDEHLQEQMKHNQSEENRGNIHHSAFETSCS